ncbi:MAG: RNA 2',3'-cyclic phosphodiesterase [Planctomycetota bacterium]
MQAIRSFIAIPLSKPVERSTAKLIRSLESAGDGIRWVPTDSLHLTLKFLGEVENTEVPSVCNGIRESCGVIDPFELQFVGTGGLPSRDRARVLHVGVKDPSGNLCRLVADLETRMADLGFKPEPRDYVPHLTLGRVRKGFRTPSDDVMKKLASHEDTAWGDFVVDRVLLVASFLEKAGPSYQTMDTIEL